MLHVEHFFRFLCCRRMPDVSGARIHIINFCFSLTQTIPTYYCFVTLVLEVVILFESHSLSIDIVISFARFDSSSKNFDATSSSPMFHCSVLLEA